VIAVAVAAQLLMLWEGADAPLPVLPERI
jgi:hypothetical protein